MLIRTDSARFRIDRRPTVQLKGAESAMRTFLEVLCARIQQQDQIVCHTAKPNRGTPAATWNELGEFVAATVERQNRKHHRARQNASPKRHQVTNLPRRADCHETPDAYAALNIDETGCHQNGNRTWLWTVIGKLTTLFAVRPWRCDDEHVYPQGSPAARLSGKARSQ